MKSVLALAVKDLRILVRDRVGFFFIFFFPVVYAVFFGHIFAGEGEEGVRGLKVAVVDEDRTDASRKFVATLAAAPELDVQAVDRAQAVGLVRRGQRLAYVVIPAGFGAGRDRLLRGEGIRLEVGVDPARQAESGMMRGILTQYAFRILQDLFMSRDAMRSQVKTALADIEAAEDIPPLPRAVLTRFLQEVDRFMVAFPEEEGSAAQEAAGAEEDDALGAWEPIRIEFSSVARESRGPHPQSSFDITAPQSFVWMFLGCSAAFAVSLVMERTRGTLMRLRSAPITVTHILAGKALACFFTSMAGLVVLFAFFYFVYGVRAASYPLLLGAFVSAAAAFVGVMMFVSVLGKTEAAVGGIGWAILIVMAMLGGGMLPLFFMPSWMQTVSHVSFVKWTVLAIEGALWRGFTPAEMALPCGILLAIGAATFTAGAVIFKKTAD